MSPHDELEEFRRQCERQLRRPLADRIRFGFFRNPDPVKVQCSRSRSDDIRHARGAGPRV